LPLAQSSVSAMVREVEAKLKGQLKLGPGSKVQIDGLKNQKELNGLVGHLLKFDPAKLRWGVKLADGKQVALKMDNLRPVDLDVITPDDALYTPPPVTPCMQSTSTSADDSTCDKACADSGVDSPGLVDTSDSRPQETVEPVIGTVDASIASASSPEQNAEGVTSVTTASLTAKEVGEASTPMPCPATEAKSKEEIEVLANDDDWPVLQHLQLQWKKCKAVVGSTEVRPQSALQRSCMQTTRTWSPFAWCHRNGLMTVMLCRYVVL